MLISTIITSCMLLGLIIATPWALSKKCPQSIRLAIGAIVLLGGIWNFAWYGLQNYSGFWGKAALGSGILMIVTALYILAPAKLPKLLHSVKPLVLILLLGFALLYVKTLLGF